MVFRPRTAARKEKPLGTPWGGCLYSVLRLCPPPSYPISARSELGFKIILREPEAMIARVTLELALRKEFDYLIPPELTGQIDIGSRVQVPFGSRKVLGCVTGLAEESADGALVAG